MLESTHQTVRLGAGSHETPGEGACVVELASLLSDEPFSDRPKSVCPALREFLHGYNDGLPDSLRQELYGLASDVVGSRASAHITAWRARLCVDWADSLRAPDDPVPGARGTTLRSCSLAGERTAAIAREDIWRHRQTLAFFSWLAHARASVRRPSSPLVAALVGGTRLPASAARELVPQLS